MCSTEQLQSMYAWKREQERTHKYTLLQMLLWWYLIDLVRFIFEDDVISNNRYLIFQKEFTNASGTVSVNRRCVHECRERYTHTSTTVHSVHCCDIHLCNTASLLWDNGGTIFSSIDCLSVLFIIVVGCLIM